MKLFMAYKGQFFHADDDALLKALQKGKDAGADHHGPRRKCRHDGCF